jgi:hypothetical protein
VAGFAAAALTRRRSAGMAASLARVDDGCQHVCAYCTYPAVVGAPCAECGRMWTAEGWRWLGRWIGAVRLAVLILLGAAVCLYTFLRPFDPAMMLDGIWRWGTLQTGAPWNYDELCGMSRWPEIEVPADAGVSVQGRLGRLDFVSVPTPAAWQPPPPPAGTGECFRGSTVYAWKWTPVGEPGRSARVHLSVDGRVKYFTSPTGPNSIMEFPVEMGGPGLYVKLNWRRKLAVRGEVIESRSVPLDDADDGWRAMIEAANQEVARITAIK